MLNSKCSSWLSKLAAQATQCIADLFGRDLARSLSDFEQTVHIAPFWRTEMLMLETAQAIVPLRIPIWSTNDPPSPRALTRRRIHCIADAQV
jgi:hypothetical protein